MEKYVPPELAMSRPSETLPVPEGEAQPKAPVALVHWRKLADRQSFAMAEKASPVYCDALAILAEIEPTT